MTRRIANMSAVNSETIERGPSIPTKFEIDTYASDIAADIQTDAGSEITYNPNFLTDTEQASLFETLRDDVPWVTGIYKMFGRSIPTPRKLWAMGDFEIRKTSKYKVTEIGDYLPEVLELKERIEEAYDTKLRYVQLNYYRSGADYIGWHTDKEVQKGDSIYSISLGAPRRFILRTRDYKTASHPKKHCFTLAPGSIITLNREASTVEFSHMVPKERSAEPRINLTFRNE